MISLINGKLEIIHLPQKNKQRKGKENIHPENIRQSCKTNHLR
ncbi:hypothetical protein ZOSMA_231G00230 [Zostera marina]|uniref:Uncharacterized protein n=1 Tax=Zostera marina TaxID=29655 RepID=A0A0K9PKD0_ZOSMR|nr:hypothetical protein ZOSMA_231G00230 [Zostera marina]